MYSDLLPALVCPACHQPLTLAHDVRDAQGEILAGQLACARCSVYYPIHEGIADFLDTPRPLTPAQVTNEWPLTAWIYERGWRPFALTLLSREPFPYRRELPLMADLMQTQRGGLYLDVACSNGLYARALARTLGAAPGHVVGIDHSLPMLLQARRFAREARLRISYVRAEAQGLPIAAERVAGVAIGGSLNEIGDLDACLEEARRVLQPAGRFVTMTLARAATRPGQLFQSLMVTGGITFWSASELVAQFAAHGFHTIEQRQYGLVMFHLALPANNALAV